MASGGEEKASVATQIVTPEFLDACEKLNNSGMLQQLLQTIGVPVASNTVAAAPAAVAAVGESRSSADTVD
jgi:hypothetical protein